MNVDQVAIDRENESWVSGWLASEDSEHDKISVKRAYIDINDGNLYDGLLFSQIMYWHGRSKETGKRRLQIFKDGHFWLAKRYEDWWAECRIEARQAKESINRIAKRGLIIKKRYKFNGVPVVHIRVDWNAFVASIRHLMSNPSDTRCPIHQTLNVHSLTETTDTDYQSETTNKAYAHKAISGKSQSARVNDSIEVEQQSQVEQGRGAKRSKSLTVNDAEIEAETDSQGIGSDIPPRIFSKKENPHYAITEDADGFWQLPRAKQFKLPRAVAVRRLQALLALEAIPMCMYFTQWRDNGEIAKEGRQYYLGEYEEGRIVVEDEMFNERGDYSLKHLRNLAISKGVMSQDGWNWLLQKIFTDSVEWCGQNPDAPTILERESIIDLFLERDRKVLS